MTGLKIRRISSAKYKLLMTFVAVFALVAQPFYGFVASQVAHAVSATVTSQSELVAKIADTSVDTIDLGGSFTVSSQINVNRTLTLNGNGATLSAASGWNGTGGNDSIIAVTGGSPTIRNLVVDGAAAANTQGLQVWQSAATLENITALNSQKAGIHVNASTVTATNITTSNNSRGKSVWGIASFGGILVSAGGTLNIGGQSIHTSEGNHIRRDSGTVNDTNSQYTNTLNFRYTLKSAPVAPTIISPTEGQNVAAPAGEITIQWNAVSGAHSYLVAIDGGAPTPVIGGTTLATTLAEGAHKVTVQSAAASGLVGGISAERNFTVTIPDTTAPTLNITNPVDGDVMRTRVSSTENVLRVNGTFADPSGGYVELQLVGHGRAPVITKHAPVVDGELAVFDTTGYPDGNYQLLARGTDYVGNALPQQVINITIDNTAPNSTNNLQNVIGGIVTVHQTITDNTAPASGKLRIWKQNTDGTLDNSKFWASANVVAVDGDGVAVYEVNTIANLYGDGKYTAKFTSRDQAGNESVQEKVFVVDNTAPKITIKPDYKGSIDDKIFSEVSFKLYDATAIDRAELNGKPFTSNRGSVWGDFNTVWANKSWSGAVEGPNTVVLYDKAGNSASYDFVLDVTAPTATISYSPAGPSWTNKSVIVTLTTSEPIDQSALPGTWLKKSDTVYQKSYPVNNVQEVTLRDLTGNVGTATVDISWIDKVAPSIAGVHAEQEGDTVKVTGTVSDANLSYYYCYLTTNQEIIVDGYTFTPGQEVRLNNNADGSRDPACVTKWANGEKTIDGVLGGFNITGVPAGEYTVNLVAYDLAGNHNVANPVQFGVTISRTTAPADPDPVCESGQIGTPPNCSTPPSEPAECPVGQTGVYPNCVPPVTPPIVGPVDPPAKPSTPSQNPPAGMPQLTPQLFIPVQPLLASVASPSASAIRTSSVPQFATQLFGSATAATVAAPDDSADADNRPSNTTSREREVSLSPLKANTDGEVLSAQDSRAKSWSLINVILAGIIALMSLIALAGIRKNKAGSARRMLTLVPTISAIVAVLLLEDFSAAFGWFNIWTVLFAAIAVVQTILLMGVNVATDE